MYTAFTGDVASVLAHPTVTVTSTSTTTVTSPSPGASGSGSAGGQTSNAAGRARGASGIAAPGRGGPLVGGMAVVLASVLAGAWAVL